MGPRFLSSIPSAVYSLVGSLTTPNVYITAMPPLMLTRQDGVVNLTYA